MSKKLKVFLVLFFLVGLATFFMYYESTGNLVNSVFLGIIGGTVVGAIVSLAIPFIKQQRNRKKKP
jgi:uncharacterized membrane protein